MKRAAWNKGRGSIYDFITVEYPLDDEQKVYVNIEDGDHFDRIQHGILGIYTDKEAASEKASHEKARHGVSNFVVLERDLDG
ncbi:MAG: hypothetical protein LBR87_03960 [Synergistaceae bacterium]|nr:hypothetical protein [Synergistaceae bacterium]